MINKKWKLQPHTCFVHLRRVLFHLAKIKYDCLKIPQILSATIATIAMTIETSLGYPSSVLTCGVIDETHNLLSADPEIICRFSLSISIHKTVKGKIDTKELDILLKQTSQAGCQAGVTEQRGWTSGPCVGNGNLGISIEMLSFCLFFFYKRQHKAFHRPNPCLNKINVILSNIKQ